MTRLSKNIVYNMVGQIMVLILGLISTKVIYARLGGDIVGIIYFSLMANTTICMVLELGILSTTVKEISAHHKADPVYVWGFIRVFSSFYWLLYIFFGITIYFSTSFLAQKWLNLTQIDSSTAEYSLRILLISSLSSLPKSFYASIIRGVERMEFNNVIDPLVMLLQQVGILVIIFYNGNIFQISYWIAATQFLSLAAFIVACSFFFPPRQIFVPGYSASIVKRNIKYTAQMMIISLTSLVYLQADKIILSKILPISTFGFYFFAYSIISKGAVVTMAISYAAFPHISKLHVSGANEVVLKNYYKLQDMLCISIAPVFGAVVFASVPLFSHLFNEGVAMTLMIPTVFLSLGFYMTGTMTIPNTLAFVMGKPQIVARQNLLAILVVLPLTILLITLWGLVGASLSMVSYGIFCYLYSVPRICSDCIGIASRSWYSHLLKLYALIALTYGATYTILVLLQDYAIFHLLVAYCVSTMLMLVGSYFFMRRELKDAVGRFFHRSSATSPDLYVG